MKLLDGRDAAAFIQERHARQVRGLQSRPTLAIVRIGDDEATTRYLRAKQRYGEEIGAPVKVWHETAGSIIERINTLNADPATTGIIIQLPLPNDDLTERALAAVSPAKDIDGLAPNSPFEASTPKAILWLLAAYNIDLKSPVAVVGQGRLVGKPLAERLEISGIGVNRYDMNSDDLAAELPTADIVISATGHAGLITSAMIKPGTVVVDAGSPASDLAPELAARDDIIKTPNPGGVGPMTVAALFDNLLIAAQQKTRLEN